MQTEYEVRILSIDIKNVEEKLKKINAIFKWDCLQKRYVYDFNPKIDGKWIRLKTNGKKTTLTIKNISANSIDGTKELEIEVDNFEKTNLFLKELGYNPKSYQENRRRQYIFNNVEIDIDYWPKIPTYLEIEGKSSEDVLKVVKLLGFDENDITTKDVESIYLDYGFNLEEIYDLKLEEDRK